ncbi:phosphoribosyl-ATP diphosphatase [Acidisoma cellulosilytica]|uniref:Phosphoribosyl-ATP pyrophosphatase n=1 Tax=Acidisoma cellulosilyticum TaxID=2802395 RepID=A0A963YZ09_9PROT|nr:phosphoribosyl-ATP diphosphatase [Acidisoma cellulosilyticum]MCB8879694.1 phosphoribosyl-ATP diphosphatase [Acidisoma cellulosilyticum]
MAKSDKPALSSRKVKGDKLKANKKTTAKRIASRAVPAERGRDAAVLDRLWDTIESRRNADPSASHSARLMSRGTAKIAQKFGEEAVECLIEAVRGESKAALVAESADVLYHLLVLWVDADVRPDAVWAELTRREGVSGIAEKASRLRALRVSQDVETKKIP